jgi:hypothetical protein
MLADLKALTRFLALNPWRAHDLPRIDPGDVTRLF